MKKIGIVGATGFVGQKLLYLLQDNKSVEVNIAVSESSKGKKIKEEFPELNYEFNFSSIDFKSLNQMDLVFLSVPHGKALELSNKLDCKVIDLTADHRQTWTYGLPELYSKEIMNANKIANPGCYATSCILSTSPVKDSIDHVIFDCISGYSGAGKNPKIDYKDNIIGYKLTDHFHNAEIKKALKCDAYFTPHVVDVFQGILCTAHIFLKDQMSIDEIESKYKLFYQETFTKVISGVPATKAVVNTPYCHIGGFEYDNKRLVVVTAIDNLMKGAASQAVQNMNLMLGLEHYSGLN